MRRWHAVGAALVALAAASAAAQESGGPGSGLFRPLAPGIPVELRSDSLEYESSRNVYVARGDRIGEYVEKLRASDGQLGAMFALGGKIRGIEAFEHPAMLRKVLPKLVRSWAMDALSIERAGEEPQAPEVERRLGELAALSLSEHPAVGLGREVRFESQRVTGGALLHEGRVVHLCALAEVAFGLQCRRLHPLELV